jgi:Ca2+-binding RTX toxin-like protein
MGSQRQDRQRLAFAGGARGEGKTMRRILVAVALVAIGLAPVSAAAQTETHLCFGEVADTVGTSGHDHLEGDVVVGLAGRDQLWGRLTCGNAADDYTVFGSQKASGGPGGDEFVATPGSLAMGGPDPDNLFSSGASSQVLKGGEGNDEWVTTEMFPGETDFFYGGPGDDKSSADGTFEQDSRQFGGPDNDSLVGGSGRDKLYGGTGDDTLDSITYVCCGPEDDGIQDLLWGGDGFDTCIMGPTDRAVKCEDVTVVE